MKRKRMVCLLLMLAMFLSLSNMVYANEDDHSEFYSYNNILVCDSTQFTPSSDDHGGGGYGLSAYFTSTGWIIRDGVVSLSLMPKRGLNWLSSSVRENAWNAVVNAYGNSSNWANTSVMKQQFMCHANYGYIKTPWNLEPHKTSINPITCN